MMNVENEIDDLYEHQWINSCANAVYGRMTEAFANLDLQCLETVYALDCIYLSRERETPAAIGRASF